MKPLFSLLIALGIAHPTWSQQDTVWIAPAFYLTVDPNEWEILYTAPDPRMVHYAAIPQQVTHRPTGFMITFQAAYGVEENVFHWLSEEQNRRGPNKKPSTFSNLNDPKKYLRQTLFGELKSFSKNDTAQYEAYTTGPIEQQWANAYLWNQSPYYLLVSTPQHVTADRHMLLVDLLKRIQITTPEHMDRVMQKSHTPLTGAYDWQTARATWVRIQMGKSCYQRSKSILAEAPDNELVSPLDSIFSFVDLEQNLHQLMGEQLDLNVILKKVGIRSRQNSNAYHAYHVSPYRLQLCYEMLALFAAWQQFPKDLQNFEKLHLMQKDTLTCFEGATASSYQLLSIYTDKETIRTQLDSFPLHLLEYHENKIQPKHITARTSLAALVDNSILPGTQSVCLITTAHHLQQGEKIAAIYDDFYFYAPLRAKRLISFTPPENLKPYDALIRYTLDENDQYLIEKHFAALDTVRFYHDCDLRDDSPDMLYYKGPKEQELKTPPTKRLYGTNLMATDMNNNGAEEYWQLYITNGKVLKTHFFATEAADDSLNNTRHRKALLQLPQIKKLLAVSQSTSINNHQLLCRAGDSGLLQEDVSDMAVAETTFDKDLMKRIQADTSVYQYPHRAAYFRKNDYAGERYLDEYFSTKKYPLLPDIARYKVSFIVEKDGSLSNIHIHSLGSKPVYAIETQLLELVMRMPKWEPATVEDVPVRSYGALYYGIYAK